METTTKQQLIERVLLYQNDSEVNKLRAEAQSKCTLLNSIIAQGLSNDEIKEFTSSTTSVDTYIQRRQLNENKELRKLRDAGITVEAQLPTELANLKYQLHAWHSFPTATRGGNKYQHLKCENGKWEIDEAGLESEFVRRSIKLYVEGEELTELRKLLVIQEYLVENAEPGQIFSTPPSPPSFFSTRFTCDTAQSCNALPRAKFMVKYSYFRSRQERLNG